MPQGTGELHLRRASDDEDVDPIKAWWGYITTEPGWVTVKASKYWDYDRVAHGGWETADREDHYTYPADLVDFIRWEGPIRG
jgi:hypothetical protein